MMSPAADRCSAALQCTPQASCSAAVFDGTVHQYACSCQLWRHDQQCSRVRGDPAAEGGSPATCTYSIRNHLSTAGPQCGAKQTGSTLTLHKPTRRRTWAGDEDCGVWGMTYHRCHPWGHVPLSQGSSHPGNFCMHSSDKVAANAVEHTHVSHCCLLPVLCSASAALILSLH